VPESGSIHGGHHAIARNLCGRELPEHQQSLAARFACTTAMTPCEAVVISSEALDGLLRNAGYAQAFFNRIRELNLEPKLVAFLRNQSQSINSRYAQVVKGFRRSEPFEAFVQAEIHHPSFRYAHLVALADAFEAALIARPFTSETVAHGVVPEFLRTIGLDPSQFRSTEISRNPAAGPFTVSAARGVLRFIGSSTRQLTWLQAERCKKVLTAYLEEKGWADIGYCGLTTALARQIESEWRSDNDVFARHVWGRPWAEVFTADTTEEFTPNDFEMCQPDGSTDRRLQRAIHEVKAIVDDILQDPALAVEAPWNDLRQRSGWISRE
jgi:hypothetical protein